MTISSTCCKPEPYEALVSKMKVIMDGVEALLDEKQK
jgi:hypothetical protein